MNDGGKQDRRLQIEMEEPQLVITTSTLIGIVHSADSLKVLSIYYLRPGKEGCN